MPSYGVEFGIASAFGLLFQCSDLSHTQVKCVEAIFPAQSGACFAFSSGVFLVKKGLFGVSYFNYEFLNEDRFIKKFLLSQGHLQQQTFTRSNSHHRSLLRSKNGTANPALCYDVIVGCILYSQ